MRLIIWLLVVTILLTCIGLLLWQRIVFSARKRPQLCGWIAGGEVLFAVGAGFLIAQYELRSWKTWTTPPLFTIIGVSAAWVLAIIAVACKALAHRLRDEF